MWILVGSAGCKTHPGRDLWPAGLREARGALPCANPDVLEGDGRGGKLAVGLGERCVSYMHLPVVMLGMALSVALVWFSMINMVFWKKLC